MNIPLFRKQIRDELLIFAAWAIMVIWLISRHAIWFDEARAWLIATRTSDWSAMLSQTYADGHPVLWYIFLRLGSYVHDSLQTLYSIHFIFAAIAAGLTLALRQLPLALRVLLIFGGILGYEYAVVARNYAPAAAALLAFAFFYPDREKYPLLLGAFLAIALNFHAGIAPIAPFFMLPWFILAWRGPKRAFAIASTVIALGYCALLISIYPPHPESIFTSLHRSNQGLPIALSWSSKFLFPVLTFGLDDIGNLLGPTPILIVSLLMVIFFTTVFFLYRTWPFRSAALGMLILSISFYMINYPFASYRHGALVVVALFCLLAMEGKATLPLLRQKIAMALFSFLLLVQFGRVVLAAFIPASMSHEVMAYLSRPELRNAQILCLPEWMGQSLTSSGASDCYMLFLDRRGTYPLFLMSDYKRPVVTWSDINVWMEQTEASGVPALVYLNEAFKPEKEREPSENGRRRRWGHRFQLLGSDSEIDHVLARTDILIPDRPTIFPESGLLLRLKPEFRGGPSPSVPQRTDP